MTRSCTIATLLILSPALAWGGKLKTVSISAPGQYEKAQFQQTVVSNEGVVRLSRIVKPLTTTAPIDASRIWDVVEDKSGNIFLATGDDGRVLKVAPTGEVTIVYDGDESQILCLAAAADGSIYAGTGPGGQIVRIDPMGNAKVLYDSPESYVWALALNEKDGSVFAATGPHGRIYRVQPDGKANVFFQAKQDHILCLARDADGTLFAGTDKQGLVYRIDDRGKGFVLFQAAQAEVRCLQVVGSALYVGTSSPSGGRGSASASAIPGPGRDVSTRGKPEATRVGATDRTALAVPASRPSEREGERTAQASSAAPAGGGENSVYRVGFDGSVRELFREKGLVLSLHKHGDVIYVGGSSKGVLFEVNESTRERSELARLEGGHVQRLYSRRDGGILIAMGEPANLFVLNPQRSATGTVIGEVIDAKLASRWGAIQWHSDVPEGTRMTIAVRGGNVAEPDETWSDWSQEQIDPRAATAKTPPCRYLQWRATLVSEKPAVSPALSGISFRFATLNQAPDVASIESPNSDSSPPKEPKKLRFKWSATDANEDELTFDLFVLKEGWKDWIQVEDGWGKTEYEWDTTTMPTGNYRFKVVASDRTDNNEGEALTGERVSGWVAVAHETPVVTIKFVGIEKDRANFEASASSTIARLAGATYSLDGGRWQTLFPIDALFDSRAEKFRFQSDAIRPGSHVMVLRVRDSAGNVGATDVVFEFTK